MLSVPAAVTGSFYPAGMKPADYLKFYSTKLQTVEIYNTFYRTPSVSTVTGWYEKTPPDFVFAATHPGNVLLLFLVLYRSP